MHTLDWTVLYRGLVAYKEKFGHIRVPAKFIVPEDDTQWPRITRGLKLGPKTAAIRSIGRYVKDSPDRKKRLDELGR